MMNYELTSRNELVYLEPILFYMRLLTLFILFFVFSFAAVSAQDYFQQEVHYQINVALNDSTNSLSAFERITYINHSPQQPQLFVFSSLGECI